MTQVMLRLQAPILTESRTFISPSEIIFIKLGHIRSFVTAKKKTLKLQPILIQLSTVLLANGSSSSWIGIIMMTVPWLKPKVFHVEFVLRMELESNLFQEERILHFIKSREKFRGSR